MFQKVKASKMRIMLVAFVAATILGRVIAAFGETDFSTNVQAILGVPSEGPSILPLLDAALKERVSSGHIDASSAAADRLVDALLNGCVPNEVQNAVLADSHVDQHVIGLAINGPMAHSWDEPTDANDLVDGLVRRAESLPLKDPRGVKLARAALVLTAQSMIRFDGWLLNNVPSARRGQHTGAKPYELADLDTNQTKAIHALFTGKPGPRDEFGALSQALDDAIATNGALAGTKSAKDFVNVLARSWGEAWPGSGHSSRWRYANQAWRYACLCRARKDDKAFAELAETVEKMRKGAGSDAVEMRWLDEIMTLPGPSPKNSGVWRIKGPDDLKPPL